MGGKIPCFKDNSPEKVGKNNNQKQPQAKTYYNDLEQKLKSQNKNNVNNSQEEKKGDISNGIYIKNPDNKTSYSQKSEPKLFQKVNKEEEKIENIEKERKTDFDQASNLKFNDKWHDEIKGKIQKNADDEVEIKRKAAEEKERKKEKSLEFKQKGNDHFNKKEYQKAIEEYTKAINLYNESSIYFSNRAMCYRNLKNFSKAGEDCKNALALDGNNLKAFNVLGISLIEMGKYDQTMERINEGLKHIETMMIKPTTNMNFRQIFERNLIIGNKIKFLKEKSLLNERKEEMHAFLLSLIDQDKAQDKIKQDEFKSDISALLNPKSTPMKIPEHLTCRISFGLISEGSLTPDGFTYEKKELINHLKNGGNFDPMSRSHLSIASLLPNKNIDKAVESYVKENPWAAITDYELNYEKITFDE